jgi:hypothetical protein
MGSFKKCDFKKTEQDRLRGLKTFDGIRRVLEGEFNMIRVVM